MKKNYRTAITVITALFGLAGGGYGAWQAWETGLIGDNPRAPTPKAMEEAVKKQARYILTTTGASVTCLNVDITQPQPEIRGVPGITIQAVPGQHSVTLQVQTNARDQTKRDLQIAQLDYLTKQGLFTSADTTINSDDDVSHQAKSYRLTWVGFANTHYHFGGSLCLPYGRREFAGIGKIEKLLDKTMGLDVYEVEYQTKVAEIPAWAQAAEAQRLFPKLAELTDDRVDKAKVIRTKDGWRSAVEIETELSMASKGASAEAYLKAMLKRIDLSPALTLEEAKSLMAKMTSDLVRASRSGVACVPIIIQRGGDEKETPGQDAAGLLVTYFDRDDRKDFEYSAMANALHVLSALEGAGLAEMEIIRPAPLPRTAKPLRSAAPKPAEEQRPVGIRYKVGKEAIAALGISAYGGGCVPAGRIKAEALAVRSGLDNFSAQLQIRATVEQTPELALKIAERLPAVKTVIENGFSMNGSLIRQSEGPDAGKWRLGGMNPVYPSMFNTSIPAHLVPLMPLTAAALSNKRVKAPALAQESSSSKTARNGMAPQAAGLAVAAEDIAMIECADFWETEAIILDDQQRHVAEGRARGVDTSFEEKVNTQRAQFIKAKFLPKCEKFGFVWPTGKAGIKRNEKTMEKIREKAESLRKELEKAALAEAIRNESRKRSGESARGGR
ncbi:MAG: hypothetical protein R3E35_11430 [Rhodocyclaceae bacterium]